MPPTPPDPDLEDVAPFVLPFDGHRPILICGHPKTGKTSFLRHLIARLPPRAGVYVIDPIGASDYTVADRQMSVLNPAATRSDAQFFEVATDFVNRVVAETGSMLVIDEFSHLTAPYSRPLPQQQAFLDSLSAAVRSQRGRYTRVLLASSLIPKADFIAQFGARFYMGPSTPMDWNLMFGQHEHIESKRSRGGGVMCLDGHFQHFAFPLEPPVVPQIPNAGKARFHRFGKRAG